MFCELDGLREEAGLGWHVLDTSTGRKVPGIDPPIENPGATPLGWAITELESERSEGPLRFTVSGLGEVTFRYDPSPGSVELSDPITDTAVVRFVLPEPLGWVGVLGDLLAIGGASKGRIYLLQVVLGAEDQPMSFLLNARPTNRA